MTGTILIVDDEDAITYAFRRYFEARGWRTVCARSIAEAMHQLQILPPDIAFVDVCLPDGNGLDLMSHMHAVDPPVAIIPMTAYGSLEIVTRALKSHAFDFLIKPIDLDDAGALVEQIMRVQETAEDAKPSDPSTSGLVGRSVPMQRLYKQIARTALSAANVLIQGETGAGKELVARAIHRHSRRSKGPFVAVNCGALPEHLVESELFGYSRGSFTGAERDKPGRFEAANGGTLFLDEIGELSKPAQVKLLRFLDTQVVERLGSVRAISLDVRVLAATNRNLPAEVTAGRFRADLFYRLAVVQLHLPPLREHRDDIRHLADHFLHEFSFEGSPLHLSEGAAACLEAYPWPGNVRELRNVMQHAALNAGAGLILPAHLPDSVRAPDARSKHSDSTALSDYLDQIDGRRGRLYSSAIRPVEEAVIARALAEADGNQSAAADILGIHRNTLRQKLRDFAMRSDDHS